MMKDKRLNFPSAGRNAEPILQVLKQHLPQEGGSVLEIASGSGQHAVAFCSALPQIRWWPSDKDPVHIDSINAWRTHMDMTERLHEAQILDVRSHNWRDNKNTKNWPSCFDVIININMIHISPWDTTHSLMRGAAKNLCGGGRLLLYGPYKIDGEHTAPSNAEFDQSLRARNPEWGVRNLEEVVETARAQGLTLRTSVSMPSNNYCVIFERT